MNPRVKQAIALTNYQVEILFQNGEIKVFDTKPYLNVGVFQELKDEAMFYTVKAFNGTVTWENGLDFCPDTLYLESKGGRDNRS